ncbi:TPA: prophage tail fiber N-terminal domain-containing protein [Serratia fonticola]|nr:prophage tail fiber N-terminal domain-containing protein [Serratia fonticola]
MSSILVSGVLVNPFNRPLPNAIITLTSISNSFTVLTGANVTSRTNDAGEYEFHLQPGNYAVYVAKDSYRDFYGAITTTPTTPPTTLNVLLKQNAMEAELPPDLVEFFQQVQNQVVVVGNGVDEAARIATEKAAAAAVSERNSGEYKDTAGQAASSAGASAATAEEIARKLGDLEQLIRDAGYAPIDSFEQGAALTSIGQALRQESTGVFYSWRGVYPKIVPIGSTPELTGGVSSTAWVDVNDLTLRKSLATPEGDPIVVPEKVRIAIGNDAMDEFPNASLADILSDVNPKMWKHLVIKGATPDEDDWTDAIEHCIDYAYRKNKKVVEMESHGISRTIELPSPINIEFLSKLGSWYALPGFVGDMVKSKNAPEGDYLTILDPNKESNGIFIRNMTLFGNWVNDVITPSYVGVRDGIRLFGVQHDLDNCRVMNVRGKAFNIGGRSNTSVKGMAPSDYSRLRADWCGEEAFIFGGSSDSHADRIKVRDAGQLSNAVYKAIRVGQNGTLRADKFHVWNGSTSMRHECCLEILAYDCIFMNSHFEGANNCQVRIVGGRNQIIGVEVYNQWSSGGAMIEVLNNSNSINGRAFISALILPDVSVYAVKLGNADNQVAFTDVDLKLYNTKLGAFKIDNHAGFLSGKVVGDTLNYTATQNRALVVTGSLVQGKDSVIFDTPQYKSFIGAGSINLDLGLNAVGDLYSQSGSVIANTAVFRSLPTTPPSIVGGLYADPATGNVKVKL